MAKNEAAQMLARAKAVVPSLAMLDALTESGITEDTAG
jgi:hypothetical protein